MVINAPLRRQVWKALIRLPVLRSVGESPGSARWLHLLETTATGMVGGVLTNIQETFKLSDTLAGFISTAAVLGSLLVALLSARLAHNARRVTVLASGAVLWTLVALGSAWAPLFVLFLLSRSLLGATAQLLRV